MADSTINYSSKFSPLIAERWKHRSYTDPYAGKNYKWSKDFNGAKTVYVYSVDTVEMNNFNREAASNRFGAVANLGDTIDEMVMTQDKSFAFTIDRGDNSDQAIEKSAARALKRQVDERITPMVDKYRFQQWATNAGTKETYSGTLDGEAIYDKILTIGGKLDNEAVPTDDRVLFIPVRNYIKLLKLDVILALEKLGTKAISRGQVGELDGMKVVKVPDSYLADVDLMVKGKGATVDPVKLTNYYIRRDAQGFDGPVVEGRIYYDAFVLDTYKKGVATLAAGT